MIAPFLTERKKQHWKIGIIGVAFCGMVSMAFVNYSLTGSILPFPSKSRITSAQEPLKDPSSASVTPSNKPAEAFNEPKPMEATHSLYTGNNQTSIGPNLEPARTKPANVSKQVALTFDDGPDNKYTPKILDILKQNNVKATFFVVGNQVSKYPKVLKRIYEEGHAIGNHSWDHADFTKLSSARVEQELKDTDDWILKTIGITPSLVRVPYGAVSASVKKEIEDTGRPLIGWNVDPQDWAGSSSADIIRNIKTHTKAGSIILLHSFGGKQGKLDNTVEALPSIIAYLKKEEFELVTVPEMNATR